MKPFILNSNHLVMFDVDSTLVLYDKHERSFGKNNKQAMKFQLPRGYDTVNGPEYYYLKPNQHAIDRLKDLKKQDYKIGIWSAGGAEWAENVARTLGLIDHVELIISKPFQYVDDLNSEHWMEWVKVNPDGSLK